MISLVSLSLLCDWSRNSKLYQSDVVLEPIVMWSVKVSCALGRLQCHQLICLLTRPTFYYFVFNKWMKEDNNF